MSHTLPTAAQYITCRLVPRPDGRTDKIPTDPATGRDVNAHDPNVWTDYATAASRAQDRGQLVAFAFSAADPYFFVDIDHAAVEGQWSSIALDLIGRFPGAYVELSQGGDGLHIIGQYTGDEPPHKCKNIPLGIELYTSGRFVALTERNAQGSADTDHTAQLYGAIQTYYERTGTSDDVEWSDVGDVEWSDVADDDWNGPDDDEELLARAFRAKSASSVFGGRASFSDLYHANADKLADVYPDTGPNGREYDASSADAALAQHLAFWTGKNPARIERMMRASALVRDKWDDRPDYLQRTILGACGQCSKVYKQADPKPPQIQQALAPVAAEVAKPTAVEGSTYLNPTSQVSHFTGCVYIRSMHRVLVPGGALLRPEQFKATYGGCVFGMDAHGEKTTRNAFEAFTENTCYNAPQADLTAFQPQLIPSAVYYAEGLAYANTYYPAEVESQAGDVGPFLDLMERQLPDQRDRAILTAYMAACVQFPGVKFQWCPLIQGVPGNGKTLYSRCVSRAVGRRYSHFPKATEIDSKFNAWLEAKLFIGVEDVYVPDTRQEVIEILKPYITSGDGIEIQQKGADQKTTDICCNFILNTNHKDAIRKTQDDRRFAIFYTKQQSGADIDRDGLGGDYFPNLYDWLKHGGGYAAVTHYLQNYEIPEEFNPAGACHRSPETSTTHEAIAQSLGSIEQEIVEAIEAHMSGFCGDFVSSFALDKLLDSLRLQRSVPRRKRVELMASLGYIRHPALKGGRVDNPLPGSKGKPVLYVKESAAVAALTDRSAVVQAYITAQATQDFGAA